MIWHCVPLHNEGTISFSGNLQRGNPNSVSITERERLDSSMPNNRRGGWALQCQNNRRSLLSISRPMNPDPINLKRILSTNNCRLANRQLSSRDGTYVYQCHAMLTLPFHIQITTSIFSNKTTFHNLSPHPIPVLIHLSHNYNNRTSLSNLTPTYMSLHSKTSTITNQDNNI